MSKDLTIPKRGDLVVAVQSGLIGDDDRGRRSLANRVVPQGEMGIVTWVRGGEGVGHLHVKWFNGVVSKHHLNGKWARHVAGWKQWLRVVEHKT